MLRYFREDVVQVLVYVKSVAFSSLNDAVRNSAGLCPTDSVYQDKVLSPDCEGAYSLFAAIVVYGHVAIFKKFLTS